jgi:hypothetical protein
MIIMPYVYQAGVFTSIAINVGLADYQLQSQLALVSGTAISYTKTARNLVTTSLDVNSSDQNTDATTILTQAFRNTENSLNSTLSSFYSSTLNSLNNYFSSIVGATFRDYFDSKSAATRIDYTTTTPLSAAIGYSSFRDVYRRTYATELIYRLYNYNSSGVLSSTAGTYGFAGSLLEIRKYSNSGTAGTIILSAIRTSDNGTDTLTIPINAGVANTYYNAITTSGSNTRYSRVNAVSVNGFSSTAGAGAASTFEIWVR